MTCGPRSRTSVLLPDGTSLSSVPGSGTPMQSLRTMGKCALVAAGPDSVMPQEVVISMSEP